MSGLNLSMWSGFSLLVQLKKIKKKAILFSFSFVSPSIFSQLLQVLANKTDHKSKKDSLILSFSPPSDSSPSCLVPARSISRVFEEKSSSDLSLSPSFSPSKSFPPLQVSTKSIARASEDDTLSDSSPSPSPSPYDSSSSPQVLARLMWIISALVWKQLIDNLKSSVSSTITHTHATITEDIRRRNSTCRGHLTDL